MKTGTLTPGFAYLRLSSEEAQGGESGSITHQRMIIENYCRLNNISVVSEFADDGWSGGNFDRPAFKEMLRRLDSGDVCMVITKDLSRLGRDMREASYYAEQFFPERGIRYIAIADNFDTERENIMAPFQFAMNEVYLRDGSRKVRDVLRSKRERGCYCACPPYGYRKSERDADRLMPDSATAPVVCSIFRRAAAGDSARKIALDLSAEGVVPPLKYRVLYRDDFSAEGAARASDSWNCTTVRRILKNPVYLGHTLLGKSRKASVKSKKKVPVPSEDWAVTEHTHEPLVSTELYERAQRNLGRERFGDRSGDDVRKSIFGGMAVCGRCGHALCSCGTVYKGEREKYWFLSCTHQRRDIAEPCEGVRIRYTDLCELVRRELNALLSLGEEEKRRLACEAVKRARGGRDPAAEKRERESMSARLTTIDRIIAKMYADNAEGKLDDERLTRMVAELERESAALRERMGCLDKADPAEKLTGNFEHFFALAERYTQIERLDRDVLLTFVERIEVGPKELPQDVRRATHGSQPFRQSVRIFYRFIGELAGEPVRSFPQSAAGSGNGM